MKKTRLLCIILSFLMLFPSGIWGITAADTENRENTDVYGEMLNEAEEALRAESQTVKDGTTRISADPESESGEVSAEPKDDEGEAPAEPEDEGSKAPAEPEDATSENPDEGTQQTDGEIGGDDAETQTE